MRKTIFAAIAAAAAIGALTAPQAQAQNYPSVSSLTPFSEGANFMSKPGYLRYRYFVSSGQWITYGDAARIVAEQGG